MVALNFSLTEKLSIDPALARRAAPAQNAVSIPQKFQHFCESELVTRTIAITTSFFAGADSIIHLLSAIYKGSHIVLRKLYIITLPAPKGSEVKDHLIQSVKFLGIALIGSIVGVINPSFLKYFRGGAAALEPFIEGPSTPTLDNDSPNIGRGGHGDWRNTSETVRNLWDKAQIGNQQKNREAFNTAWEKTKLADRREFVTHFDREEMFDKNLFSESIYRNFETFENRDLQLWPSQKRNPTFYHATSEKGLEGILTRERVEVRHEKVFKGAFVSTKPELEFGNYVIIFKRNIERLSSLEHGFSVGDAFWAGFSRDIPVTPQTVEKIIIIGQENLQRNADWVENLGYTVGDITDLPRPRNTTSLVPEEWLKQKTSEKLQTTIKNTLGGRGKIALTRQELTPSHTTGKKTQKIRSFYQQPAREQVRHRQILMQAY